MQLNGSTKLSNLDLSYWLARQWPAPIRALGFVVVLQKIDCSDEASQGFYLTAETLLKQPKNIRCHVRLRGESYSAELLTLE